MKLNSEEHYSTDAYLKRRCCAISIKTGHPCKLWGIAGTNPPRCQFHGGRHPNHKKYNRVLDRFHPMYKHVLSPALRALIEGQLEQDPDEQTSILEELALLRAHAAAFVKLYGIAVEQADSKPDDQAAFNRVLATGSAMAEALLTVSELADKAAKIQVKQKDRFSLADMKYVVDSIVIIIHQALDGDPEAAKAIGLAIESQLKLPLGYGSTAHAQGTELRPADTVAREYDDSIPYEPSEDDDDDDDEE